MRTETHISCDICEYTVPITNPDLCEQQLDQKGWLVKKSFGLTGGTHVCEICKSKATEQFTIVTPRIAEALLIAGCDVGEAWNKALEHTKRCRDMGLATL